MIRQTGAFTSAVTFIADELKRKAKASNCGVTVAPVPVIVTKPGIFSSHNALRAQQCPDADQGTTGGIAIELRQYHNRAVSVIEANPFEEWISMRSQYPNLYELAMQYLPILATSVSSERVFSKAGRIVTKQGNRLRGKHLHQLLFLSSVSHEMRSMS